MIKKTNIGLYDFILGIWVSDIFQKIKNQKYLILILFTEFKVYIFLLRIDEKYIYLSILIVPILTQ